MADERAQVLLAVDSQFSPDTVAGPRAVYDEGMRFVTYPARESGHLRATFERWDSMRVCRGEHPPVPLPKPYGPGVFIIENSRWLRERHAYEARYYRDAYNFGGDVDEMLTEYEHYLFCFHDEFVEVLAAGVWFEHQAEPFAEGAVTVAHPLLDLPASVTSEVFTAHEIVCQVRRDPRPDEEILAASRFCSQSPYQFALLIDGDARVSYRLQVRTQHGRTTCRWRASLGRVEQTWNAIPGVEELKTLFATFAGEVRERRRKMGR